jgi:hypothetical protein
VIVVAIVAGALGWRALQGQDQVAAAVSAAAQPPQLRTRDRAAIRTWCEREAERPIPGISGPSIEPVGARMDRRGNDEIVTVAYVTTQHRTIRVSWLDASPTSPRSRSVGARSIAGRTVLVVMSGAGTAVVSGDAPSAILWDVAARIEAV